MIVIVNARLHSVFALLLISAATAIAQGTIGFGNASTMSWGSYVADRNVKFGPTFSSIDPNMVGANVSSNALGYDFSGLRAQLFYSLAGGTDINTFTSAPGGISTFKQSTSPVAGSWFYTVATVPGWNGLPGSHVSLAVVVWDSQLSTDALSASARSGPWGVSSIFDHEGTTSPFPWDYLMTNLRSFDINIPEPSACVLVGLGGLTLAFARRRSNASAEKASARDRV